MTDEMERQAEEVFEHLEALGDGSMLEGVYEAVENGYFVGEIADSAYRFEREVNAGRRIIVGVNAYTEGAEDDAQNLLRIGHETEEYQLKRLATVKQERNDADVADALARVTADANDPNINLMPGLIEAVRALATEEEIVMAMESVFGTYVERAIV